MDKYHYDNKIDALSITKEKYEYAYSLDITSEIIIDLNDKKEVIGLEILDASKVLELNKDVLEVPEQVNAEIQVQEDELILNLTIKKNNSSIKSSNKISGLFNSKLNSFLRYIYNHFNLTNI